MQTNTAQVNDNFLERFGTSNWFERSRPAFNEDGSEAFRTASGELIEGIYLSMPNDLYHSLPALSSSGMKKFVESPALYAREYLSNVSRKRTLQLKRTLDAGTYGHELCLEEEGFYDRYFRDVVPTDFPEALHTTSDIEKALVAAGLTANESKDEKLARLVSANPSVDTSKLKTIKDIDAELENAGLSKSESKADKARRLAKVVSHVQVFDVLFEENRLKHGQPETAVVNGETVTLYGGKLPIDGVVWDDAHRVKASVRGHSQANAILTNGMPEVAIIAKCPITDLWLKVKFDWLRFDDDAADVKTTLSTKPEDFKRQIKKLHYDIQLSFYAYVAELVGIFIGQFSLVAVEYVNADICQPYELQPKTRIAANKALKKAFKEFVECKKTNNWWGWSKEDCVIVLE